ncbi:MAG TPA: zinc-binding dehydrogenase [Mycobacteriales bacterium]|nr:zinc-binding dehydrogenase [Mycobacteriales bacterium]
MLAAVAVAQSAESPLDGLRVGEHPDPVPPPGWEVVRLRAATLNHHDLWSLRGVGLAPGELPRVLGCDGAGVTADGREVLLHAVVGEPSAGAGDETLDPAMSLLSERYDGTLADLVAVPSRNVVAKPATLSWGEAACLPTAWLTAYRMLFVRGGLRPGHRVLVQGAGGGVATACLLLARAAGLTVYVTSRDETRLARALELGASEAVLSGARLPSRVDAVMETVGAATWSHSLKSLEPGGVVVVSGATSGPAPSADLTRVFYRQLRVVGSTMGTRRELEELIRFLAESGVRPLIDSELPLADARSAFERLDQGAAFGKVVVTMGDGG